MEAAKPTPSSPLTQRLSNKNWKVRAEVYSELQNSFRSADGDAERNCKYLLSMVSESNPQAQGPALENLDLFLRHKAAGRLSGPGVELGDLTVALLDNVVSRTTSAKKGQASVVLACKAFGVEAMVDALLVCAQHKAKQKAVPALDMLVLVIGTFGIKSHSPTAPKTAAMIKGAVNAAQASDPAIRKGGMMVLASLHAIIGDPLMETLQSAHALRAPQLASLREVIQAQEQAAEEAKENTSIATPCKPTGTSAASAAAAAAAAAVGAPSAVAGSAIPAAPAAAAPASVQRVAGADAWAAAGTALLDAKWQERSNALGHLLELGTPPVEVAVGVVDTMVTKASVLVADSHSIIVTRSLALTTAALQALRNDDSFAAVCKRVAPVLLDRLKDNKGAVVTAAEEALALLRLDGADLSDTLAVVLAHTVPKVRQLGLAWIEQLVERNDNNWLRPAVRAVASQTGEAFGDSSADVRRAATSLLQMLAARWGKEVITAMLFGEAGVGSRMGAARQAQLRKLLSEGGPTVPSAPPTTTATSAPVADVPVVAATAAAPAETHTSQPTAIKPPPLQQRTAPSAAVTGQSAPADKVAVPPSALPMPGVHRSVEHKANPTVPAAAAKSAAAAPTVAPATAVAPPASNKTAQALLGEWNGYAQFVEAQLRSLCAERDRSEALARRCKELESEAQRLRDEKADLEALAQMLEDRAVELEEAGAGVPDAEALATMTLDQLTQMEARFQEVLGTIGKRKGVLLEEMARKNGCGACGKSRTKSTVLFPCRHVVCSPCGAALQQCPDCKSAVAQRFELNE